MLNKYLCLVRNVTGRVKPSRTGDILIFLCPVLLHHRFRPRNHTTRGNEVSSKSVRQLQSRSFQSDATFSKHEIHLPNIDTIRQLPQQCPGCGALSQSVDSRQPGFYSESRRSIKEYLTGRFSTNAAKKSMGNEVILTTLQRPEGSLLKHLLLDVPEPVQQNTPPLCDRCHSLLHHQTGASIHHPSIESITETIREAPHKYNHVYYVIDAADFPMSLIPGVHHLLQLTPQRSLNRRSKKVKFYHGQRTDVTFIITRSDLLAPMKTQVDSLMPQLVSILRDALGSFGKDVRLGNVKCVSAKRGWWTKELKEDIWKRGGRSWMVGKVNVGKSQLFESVFPKGRSGKAPFDGSFLKVTQAKSPSAKINVKTSAPILTEHTAEHSDWEREIYKNKPLDTSLLLPPLQTETNYPAMPIVSPLPGTTVSPIRIPFGNGKGELIDLPGLSRGELELYVQKPYRSSLVMRSRITPEQQVLKPGQSLLLGGFIRITPNTDTIILAYAFTPLSVHLTSTVKAVGIQTQTRASEVKNISIPEAGNIIQSAGKFPLKWDVTKQRSGPVTASDGHGIEADRLPYRVFSTDILIEGCGWVELAAQVRKRTIDLTDSKSDVQWPLVEVFSPKGAFIGSRRPLGTWVLGGPKNPTTKMKGRQRKSMKGVKKRTKALKRMIEFS